MVRNNRNVRLVRTPRSPARIARCQPPSAVAWRTVDLRCRATPEVVGPGSQGAIPTTRLVIVLGGTGVDATLCGHLPKFVARRVRSRLPPPPPRLVGARTPGSLRGSPPFSRCMWGDFCGLGRRPDETRGVRDEAARWVAEIVSRAAFGGPDLRDARRGRPARHRRGACARRCPSARTKVLGCGTRRDKAGRMRDTPRCLLWFCEAPRPDGVQDFCPAFSPLRRLSRGGWTVLTPLEKRV